MRSEYQKIPGPYKRDPETHKLLVGTWTSEELGLLAPLRNWIFTEKLDGTNIRVFWDGYSISWAGRTDNANISVEQRQALERLVGGPDNENLFEQQFGDTPATLYGELYGPKIQSGGVYRNDISLSIFDVRVGGFWLVRTAVEDIAHNLGLSVVPLILSGVDLPMAIAHVTVGLPSEVAWSEKQNKVFAEGLVGTMRCGLLDRAGRRIAVKIKHRDFYEG